MLSWGRKSLIVGSGRRGGGRGGKMGGAILEQDNDGFVLWVYDYMCI